MKPLIDFKLQHILSADDNTRCYLMKDLNIGHAVIGFYKAVDYKEERYILSIERTYIECLLVDKNDIIACIVLVEDEDEVPIEEAKLLQTLLVLLKEDIQAYADEKKARDSWEKQDIIHVTI